jgi:glycerate 2-kinase
MYTGSVKFRREDYFRSLIMDPKFSSYPRHLAILQRQALHAVDPARAVHRALSPNDLACKGRLFIIAAGKAAAGMSKALLETIGDRPVQGIVSAPGVPAGREGRLEYFRGGHPLPTEESLSAGEAVQRLLESTGPDDLVVALISGGGSAMLELPQAGIGLADLEVVNRALLQSGAPIRDINCIRSALSRLKAGGLARLAAPARVLSLILSDVVGNAPETVASGPTVDRRCPAGEIARILDRYRLRDKLPSATVERLSRPEPRRPESGSSARTENRIIGSNRLAGDAAAKAAKRLGFDVVFRSDDWTGEARDVGIRFAELALSLKGKAPACCIAGGESTVTTPGEGKGGRNQEVALAAAMRLAGEDKIAIETLATDGVDGPTDAAGAIVTGETVEQARKIGLEPAGYLAGHDSYVFFSALNGLVKTGPTGTNVNDLLFGLIYSQ